MKTKVILQESIFFATLLAGICNCTDLDEQSRPGKVGDPIEFNFNIADKGTSTRTTVGTDKVVYVTPNGGTTWYEYTYDDTDARWECNTNDPIRWSSETMNLLAVVRYDGHTIGTTTMNISADQSEGYESCDLLACGGTYSYTTGVVDMTLEHKVAKLVVNVTNCFDASKMTCETVSTIPATGNISYGQSDVTLTGSSDTDNSSIIDMYLSSYDTEANTAQFVAYLFPQTAFDGKFKLTCGSIVYYNTGTTVNLTAGATTTINLALQSIQGVYEFYAVNNSGVTPTSSDKIYESTYQTFTAPCTGKYKLEVWGAQGGTYTQNTNSYKTTPVSYNIVDGTSGLTTTTYLPDDMYTPWDLMKRGTKECMGGKGAYVTGTVELSKGDLLYIFVGRTAETSFNHLLISDFGAYTTASPYSYTHLDSSDNTYITEKISYNTQIHEMDGGWNGGGSAIVATYHFVTVAQIENASKKDAEGNVTTEDAITIGGLRPQYGGGGGGATDISLKNGAWDSEDHLYSRIIVAGGGGGGCYYPRETGYYDGGEGGGGIFLGTSSWTGGEGDGYPTSRGQGGTLGAAGATPSGARTEITETSVGTLNEGANLIIRPLAAGFGYGGSCFWSSSSFEGLGGGGGGWYGGSCGTGANSNGAGGGGSSWAYTADVSYNGKPLNQYHPNYGKSDGSYYPDAKYLLTNVQNQGGVREGDGFVRITLLAE